MNDFETLDAIVKHAKGNHLDDRMLSVRIPGEPQLRMHDDDVARFLTWGASLRRRTVRVDRGNRRSTITATGLIDCGRRVSVVVDVRTDLIARHGFAGIVTITELDVLNRKTVGV
ncbi:hypothetical protein [Amycolatopsis sp. NPDC059657]|uniref:hypothetical protein n=1 Tax=Amycolatopsis sp. NPDC059657 TaxID=3346899 RepID=UPI00366A925D